MRVPHETIYKSLFIESRSVLARELRAHRGRAGRCDRLCMTPSRASGGSQIKEAVSIAEHPGDMALRA